MEERRKEGGGGGARAMGNCHVYTHKDMSMNVATVKRVGCVKNGGPGKTNTKNEEK
jgi:hypothetical protein